MVILLAVASCAEAQVQHAWPMPEVPVTLTSPGERADYIARHFWCVDRVGDVDHTVLEQAFVDFLSVLPYTSGTNVQADAIDSLVIHTVVINAEIAKLAEKYLYETESPMLNEDLYAKFLQSRMACGDISEPEKTRIALTLEEIARNKSGTLAPDIEIELIDGAIKSRLNDLTTGTTAIVLFYDHDCEQCQETIAEMLDDSRLMSMLENDELKVVAVDVDLMEDSTKKQQVPNWHWASAVDDVEDHYSIRSYPSIYVVSSDGEIIIKDSSYGLITSAWPTPAN